MSKSRYRAFLCRSSVRMAQKMKNSPHDAWNAMLSRNKRATGKKKGAQQQEIEKRPCHFQKNRAKNPSNTTIKLESWWGFDQDDDRWFAQGSAKDQNRIQTSACEQLWVGFGLPLWMRFESVPVRFSFFKTVCQSYDSKETPKIIKSTNGIRFPVVMQLRWFLMERANGSTDPLLLWHKEKG